MKRVYILVGLLIGGFSAVESLRESRADDGKNAVTIPLESIYSTTGQKGLKKIFRSKKDVSGRNLEQIYERSRGVGLSSLFLTRAKDIDDATTATRHVFTGGASADQPVDPRDRDERIETVWLVVYFGIGSGDDPPPWRIESVTRQDRSIRITYTTPDRFFVSGGIHQNFAWVPLGNLGSGRYTLEMYDANKKDVTLMRSVTISDK